MRFFLSLLLSAFAVFITAYLVPGVYVNGFVSALIVAVVLALLNATLGLFLKFITAPLNWLTLGLVSLVINIFMVRVTDSLMLDFAANGFWAAAVFALALAIIQSVLGIREGKKKNWLFNW